MRSGFYYLFWGTLLQFNIVYQGFDVLPDFIGYYFIYKGLKFLHAENSYFDAANKVVLPLAVLSLANLYNFEYQQVIPVGMIFAIDIVKIIAFALNIYLVYNLLKGSYEVASTLRNSYMATSFRQRLYVFLATAGAYLVFNIISKIPLPNADALMQMVFSITFIIYVIYLCALVLVVAGMNRMYRELKVKPAQPVKARAGGKTGQSKSKR